MRLKRPCIVCGEREARPASYETCQDRCAQRLRMWRCRKRAGRQYRDKDGHGEPVERECACGCPRTFVRDRASRRIYATPGCKAQHRKERLYFEANSEEKAALRGDRGEGVTLAS